MPSTEFQDRVFFNVAAGSKLRVTTSSAGRTVTTGATISGPGDQANPLLGHSAVFNKTFEVSIKPGGYVVRVDAAFTGASQVVVDAEIVDGNNVAIGKRTVTLDGVGGAVKRARIRVAKVAGQ